MESILITSWFETWCGDNIRYPYNHDGSTLLFLYECVIKEKPSTQPQREQHSIDLTEKDDEFLGTTL
jgi:hypothetical protein